MAAKFAVELRRLNREVTDEERLLEITKEYGINSSQLAQSLGAEEKDSHADGSKVPSPPKSAPQTSRVTFAAVTGTHPTSLSAGGAETPIADNGSVRPVAHREKTVREKIWQIFSEPTSSRLAMLIAAIVVAMIAVSVTAFIVQTLPEYVFSTDPAWSAVEYSCIAVFTLEFLLRICTCPSLCDFLKSPLNLVDLLAILPFYIELLTLGSSGSSSAGIIRVLRLVRIFRVFKVARYLPWVRVFTRALALSIQPLLMLVFVIVIGMVVFASAMYYSERGEYDAATGLWMRTNAFGEVAPSPFQSIPAAMWWAVVTMTTVGYGDMYPVTGLGKIIASVAALSGLMVIAIPVTVISTNFNAQYALMEREKEKVRARVLMLQHHFAAKKAGLDAVLDEVADMVRRNTQEFESEVASLFEQTRSELTEEIQEIIRMAYERRRLLHLQALSLGRMQASESAAGGGVDGLSPRPTASARGAAAGTAAAKAAGTSSVAAATPARSSASGLAGGDGTAASVASATGVALSPREWR